MVRVTKRNLYQTISDIMQNGDLDSLTAKKIRLLCQEKFKVDLTSRKDEIDDIVMSFVRAKSREMDGEGSSSSSTQNTANTPQTSANETQNNANDTENNADEQQSSDSSEAESGDEESDEAEESGSEGSNSESCSDSDCTGSESSNDEANNNVPANNAVVINDVPPKPMNSIAAPPKKRMISQALASAAGSSGIGVAGLSGIGVAGPSGIVSHADPSGTMSRAGPSGIVARAGPTGIVARAGPSSSDAYAGPSSSVADAVPSTSSGYTGRTMPPKKARRNTSADLKKMEMDDAAIARQLQAEEWNFRKGTSNKLFRNTPPKKTDSSGKTKKKKTSAFSKKCLLSPELAEVLGATEMSRPEVVQKMWAVVKQRNLFDPSNKQFILCDDELTDIFGKRRVRLIGMMKFLKRHITDIK